jgi:hypothetical protein
VSGRAKAPDEEPTPHRRRNEHALKARLRTLGVDTVKDPRAAMLITLAERLDSGKFAAHDAQQYRLALADLERSSTTMSGSTTDRLREQREKREREALRARTAEGEPDTAP